MKNDWLFSAGNILSERLDNHSIAYWLSLWRQLNIPPPKVVVTDQSFTLMMAVVKALTQHTDLAIYLTNSGPHCRMRIYFLKWYLHQVNPCRDGGQKALYTLWNALLECPRTHEDQKMGENDFTLNWLRTCEMFSIVACKSYMVQNDVTHIMKLIQSSQKDEASINRCSCFTLSGSV